MARFTATWNNTDDGHWESADLVRTDYFQDEVGENIEHIAQTHDHTPGASNDGGRLRVNEGKDIIILLGAF